MGVAGGDIVGAIEFKQDVFVVIDVAGDFRRINDFLWHVFSATSTPLRNPRSPNPKLSAEYVDWII